MLQRRHVSTGSRRIGAGREAPTEVDLVRARESSPEGARARGPSQRTAIPTPATTAASLHEHTSAAPDLNTFRFDAPRAFPGGSGASMNLEVPCDRSCALLCWQR